MNTWAYNLLGTYASRKAIIVTHYFLDNGSPAPWGASGGVNPSNSQGLGIYDALKTRRNVCLFLFLPPTDSALLHLSCLPIKAGKM